MEIHIKLRHFRTIEFQLSTNQTENLPVICSHSLNPSGILQSQSHSPHSKFIQPRTVEVFTMT